MKTPPVLHQLLEHSAAQYSFVGIERRLRSCLQRSPKPSRSIHSRGVTRAVGAKEGSLLIGDARIGSIRERINDRDCVLLEIPALAAGDSAPVSSGPFGGWHGLSERDLSDGQRVVILLENVQHCRPIVARDAVERTENL